VSVVLVDKDIVCEASSVSRVGASAERSANRHSLRWFSRGARVGGAKVKLCMGAVWGSSGRPATSGGMPSCCLARRAGQRGQRSWHEGRSVGRKQRGCRLPASKEGEVVCDGGRTTANESGARAVQNPPAAGRQALNPAGFYVQ